MYATKMSLTSNRLKTFKRNFRVAFALSLVAALFALISLAASQSASPRAVYDSTAGDRLISQQYFSPKPSTKLNNNISRWPPLRPLPVNILRLTSLPLTQPGMLVAFDMIKANATLTQAFDLQVNSVTISDEIGSEVGGALSDLTRSIMDFNGTYEFMLGSDSSTENVALGQLTPVFNLIQLCVFCRSTALANKLGVYSTLVRNTPRAQDFSRTLLALLKVLQVDELATLAKNDQAVIDNMREIERSMISAGKHLQFSGVLGGYENIDESIELLSKVQPNYILAMFLTLAIPKTICELYRRSGWRADQVLYIASGPFEVQEFWVPHEFDEPGTPAWNCTVAEMAQALQGSFVIDIRVISTESERARPMIGNLSSTQLYERVAQYAEQLNLPPLLPTATYYMYDLTWAAVNALWRTGERMSGPDSNLSLASVLNDMQGASENNNYRTSKRRQFSRIFRNEIGKTKLWGIGGEFLLDKNYDQFVDLDVIQLQLEFATTATHDTSANTSTSSQSAILNPVSVGNFDTIRDRITINPRLFKFGTPNNQPPAMWLKTVAEKEAQAARLRLAIILAAIGAVLLAAIIASVIYFCLKQQERKADTKWLIFSEDLSRIHLQRSDIHGASTNQSMSSLSSQQSSKTATSSHADTSMSSFAVHLPPNRGRATFAADSSAGDNNVSTGTQLWIRIVHVSSGVALTIKDVKNNHDGSLSRGKKVTLNKLFPQASALRAITQQHTNIVHFVGLCFDKKEVDKAWILYEWASKGPLRRCVANTKFELDGNLKSSLLYDIASGIQFMHGKYAFAFDGAHGFLHTDNVVLDGKFTAKLTDYGFWQCRPASDFDAVSEAMLEQLSTRKLELLLFRAPEFLRKGVTQSLTSAEGKGERKVATKSAFVVQQLDELHHADVYSLGMIIVELYTRRPPYLYADDDPSRETLESLLSFISGVNLGSGNSTRNFSFAQMPALLVQTSDSDLTSGLGSLILECVHAIPAARPLVGDILRRIRKLPGFSTASVIENLIDKLHLYAANLESVIAERTKALADEMERSDKLLEQILPHAVAQELKRGRAVLPESFEAVSIYFSDIAGFTALSSESTPIQVVEMLNALYTMFDTVLGSFDVYKVETIGDAYMVASGLPARNGNRHLSEISNMSLNLLETIATFVISHRRNQRLNLRIGLHTGSCVAGVVGVKMPRYCLFGDTVNMASRMETTGEPSKIHISEDFNRQLASKFGDSFITHERGETMVKGKGILNTAWLIGSTSSGFRAARNSLQNNDD